MKICNSSRTVGESHLVHIAVDMEQLHGGGAIADLEQFAELMGLDQAGLLFPDRLAVYVLLAWLAVAVGCQPATHQTADQ